MRLTVAFSGRAPRSVINGMSHERQLQARYRTGTFGLAQGKRAIKALCRHVAKRQAEPKPIRFA